MAFPSSFIPKASPRWICYPAKPRDPQSYSARMDSVYARWASTYDLFIRLVPAWNRWIGTVVHDVRGPRVLDVGFGPASILPRYPAEAEIYGLDLNRRMVRRARARMKRLGRPAHLYVGSVESMPFPDGFFDTVVCTMAFSGFPDGQRALVEMMRVLRPDGSAILVDFDYPVDRNLLGVLLVKVMIASGDIVRDVADELEHLRLVYTAQVVGGFGAVHKYVIERH